MASDIKWIKVITDIFEDEKIKLIKAMPEGRTLVLIWFQLLIQAGKTNAGGWIYLTEGCAYSSSMLATLFNESQQMVELAIKLFSNKPFEMIEVDETGQIYIPNWEKHQNVESMDKIREKERLRKAKQRERQKLLMSRDSHGTSHGTSHESHATEIEKEKEKTYIPEIDDVKTLFDHWNTMGIVKHRELTQKMRSVVNARLETYTVDELKEAIDNYSSILKSDKHFFSYKWAMMDFFNASNVVMFLTENDPFNNYLKDKNKRAARANVYDLPRVEITEQERERLALARQQQREFNAVNH